MEMRVSSPRAWIRLVFLFILALSLLLPATSTARAHSDLVDSSVVSARTENSIFSLEQTTARREIWAGCGIRDSSDKRVRTFRRGATGEAYLYCGSVNYGYRHLVARNHDDEWAAYASLWPVNWRTYADWAIAQVLAAPASVTYRASNQTYAYTAPVELRNGQGVLIKVHHPIVVVASASKRIITAYPR